MRVVLLAAAAAVVLLVLTVVWVLRYVLFTRSLPRLSGKLVAPGLTQPVTIARDRLGVPHIRARSMPDAAFAMGVVHAQDRLWQMEFLRRVASGRISEFAGQEGIAVDRFMRRVGLHRVAQQEADRLSGEPKEMLEAYARGVNYVIGSKRPLPLEFRLAKLQPEPWLPTHSILGAKLLALGLSMNWDTELQRFELLRRLGPEVAAKLEIAYPDENPDILSRFGGPENSPAPEMLQLYKDAAKFLPAMTGGSNSWVVSGTKTQSGKPMLCNDPHLPPSIPSVWYAAHIDIDDDFASTGVTTPGLPFPIIGHNRDVAWGFTNSFADCQDLVIEQFEDAAATQYRTEKGIAASTVLREVIRVKGASDVVEDVVLTRHGPVVQRIDDAAAGRYAGLALQWTANAPSDVSKSSLMLQRARDWNSFREAFQGFDAPSQNVIYADREGHFGYFLCGRIPVRRRPPSGLPIPGWTGDAMWERILTMDEVPQVLDPKEGFVVTANNRIVPDGRSPYIGNDYMSGYRAARITELLRQEKLDAQKMNEIQMDVFCIPAQQVAKLLENFSAGDKRAEKLRLSLARFDGNMVPGKREPLLYEEFMRALAECALRPLCGDDWALAAGFSLEHPVFGYPGNLVGRITPFLIEKWRTGDKSLLEKGRTWNDIVDQALAVAAGRAPGGRWGRRHAIPLVHQPLGTVKFVKWLFNRRGITVGGNTDTVMATSYHPAQPYRTVIFAPSWRQIMDLGDWEKSTGVHYPGQSGQPGSRHYTNLRGRWRKNRPYPLLWGGDAVRQATRKRLELVPGEASS